MGVHVRAVACTSAPRSPRTSGSGAATHGRWWPRIPAIRGLRPKLSYASALLFADGAYVAGRDGGYARRLRRAAVSGFDTRFARHRGGRAMSNPYEMEPPFTAGDSYRDPASLPLSHEAELTRERGVRWPRYVINLGFVATASWWSSASSAGTWELMDAIPLVPLLAFVAHRIAQRIGRHDDDPEVALIIFAAFWAKMLGALTRAAVVAWSYGGISDGTEYHQFGKALAPGFRSLDFSQAGPWSGTDFMKNVTGIVYSFTGASQVSGAIVMSFLSFLGALLL